MKQLSWLISKYLLTTIVPYFAFSWLLLSVILFVQQASRYADIFFNVNIPSNLIWQLTLALIPNVIAFTCPMAMLVGTIIGLTKMQGDSELVVMRASGVGNFQIAAPILVLGILMSLFAFLVNLKGVPLASTLVRSVALQSAIKKLESPLEPGVFNSEVAGYTIYVRGGDIESGRWQNIFIYNEDAKEGTLRLITSRNGRIDTTDQASELVLENAVSSTLPIEPGQGKYITENIGEVRFAIKTRRSELIGKLRDPALSPDELGLQQLSEYADTKEGPERREAQILWQRRILLSMTPLIFCMLGTVIVLRFTRAGRGFGILLALIVLIGFYLLAFAGEQLARMGDVPVIIGGLLPIAGSVVAALWLGYSRVGEIFASLIDRVKPAFRKIRNAPNKLQLRNVFVDLTTGLRDFDMLRDLLKYFLLTLAFLSAIFVIFTAFELWKFAATIDGGAWLLVKYLFFLLPFIYLQIAPSSAMIATLATFVIKSRANEIVTWASAGQSVYRLLAPCFMAMLLLGGFNWLAQEYVLPGANLRQDAARMLLRNKGVPVNQSGKSWVANNQRIYSFDLPATSASDNEKRHDPFSVANLTVYEFADGGQRLQTVFRADHANWQDGRITITGPVEKNDLAGGKISTTTFNSIELTDNSNPFAEMRVKPNQMNSSELKQRISTADSEIDYRNLRTALEKKRATLLLPFIMALFTAPFSLSLSRKGKAAMIGYAVGLWLLFMGTTIVFEQFGLAGFLSPALAIWSPLAIFLLLGVYLLSKVRT